MNSNRCCIISCTMALALLQTFASFAHGAEKGIRIDASEIMQSFYNGTVDNLLDHQLKSHSVFLVTRKTCMFSIMSRALLTEFYPELEYAYYEYDSEPNGIFFVQSCVKQAGSRQLPFIYMCGKYVGGYHELKRLHKDQSIIEAIKSCR